jgi:hypothetical protein
MKGDGAFKAGRMIELAGIILHMALDGMALGSEKANRSATDFRREGSGLSIIDSELPWSTRLRSALSLGPRLAWKPPFHERPG